MRQWILAAMPVLFLFGTLPTVRADRAPPPDRPPAPAAQKAKLIVEVDDKAKEPKLIIPRSLANPPKKADAGINVPTIVAGVALTLGLVSAGFWFIRRGPGRSVAAGVVVVSLFVLGVSALYADVPVKPKPNPPAAIKLPADVELQEDVLIEFTDKGDAIRLIVNKASTIKAEKTEVPKQQ
jgi:hypothetical protein